MGGVGQLYQGDLDLGRRFVERLDSVELGSDVLVEDFYYGAVAVSQRLEDLAPDALILVGAEKRGRAPGEVERRRIDTTEPDIGLVRESVEGAITGYVTIDLVIDVVKGFGSAPDRIVVFELEPDRVAPSTEMSKTAMQGLEHLVRSVGQEVALTPLFALTDDLEAALRDGHMDQSDSLNTLTSIIDGIGEFEAGRGWGQVFSLRDRLRLEISEGKVSANMSHLDWSLWWGLIEELDRLQGEDASR